MFTVGLAVLLGLFWACSLMLNLSNAVSHFKQLRGVRYSVIHAGISSVLLYATVSTVFVGFPAFILAAIGVV